jgi:hypothetical protein
MYHFPNIFFKHPPSPQSQPQIADGYVHTAMLEMQILFLGKMQVTSSDFDLTDKEIRNTHIECS